MAFKVQLQKLVGITAITLSLAASYSVLQANCQNGYPPEEQQVAMTMYRVAMGPDGRQYVYTPAGKAIIIPGLNIAPNAEVLQVYRDPQNNYWYTNQYGQSTEMTEQQLQWVASQVRGGAGQQYGQGGYNQYQQGGYNQQPGGYNQSQQQNTEQSNNTNSGGGGSGLGSALLSGAAAAAGGMAGAALGSAMTQPDYHGIPYGVPMYRGGGGGYYYHGATGNTVNVTQNDYHKNAMNEWNNQKNWNDMRNLHPQNLPDNGNHPLTQPISGAGEHGAGQWGAAAGGAVEHGAAAGGFEHGGAAAGGFEHGATTGGFEHGGAAAGGAAQGGQEGHRRFGRNKDNGDGGGFGNRDKGGDGDKKGFGNRDKGGDKADRGNKDKGEKRDRGNKRERGGRGRR